MVKDAPGEGEGGKEETNGLMEPSVVLKEKSSTWMQVTRRGRKIDRKGILIGNK